MYMHDLHTYLPKYVPVFSISRSAAGEVLLGLQLTSPGSVLPYCLEF